MAHECERRSGAANSGEHPLRITRRHFFEECGVGVGKIALATLLTAGDDYEILAAVPPGNDAAFRRAAQASGIAVTRIGALREGKEPTEVQMNGRPLSLTTRSYVHGRGSQAP